MTVAAKKRASVPYGVRANKTPRLSDAEKKQRHAERHQKRKAEGRHTQSRSQDAIDRRNERRREKRRKAAEAATPEPVRVAARYFERFADRATLPGNRMSGSGLYSGYGMLLPFKDEPGMDPTPEKDRGR